VGVMESLRHAAYLYKVLHSMIQIMEKKEPDVLVLIDFPVFNMRLARAAQQRHIPVVYYFSPTVWAWKSVRAEVIARSGAWVCAVMPVEYEVYKKYNARVEYVGHPLLDLVKPVNQTERIRQSLGLSQLERVVALLPGSRKHEVKRLLPPMLSAVDLLRKKDPRIVGVIVSAEGMTFRQIKTEGILVTDKDAAEVFSIAEMALICCGTATLEAALMGVPQIAMYRLSWLSYQILKELVKTPYIALPNIAVGESIVPELVQNAVKVEIIAQLAWKYLSSPEETAWVKKAYKKVADSLGPFGAASKTAGIILEKAAEKGKPGR
jgi:lipid-A-disaccharide synthase